MAVEHRTSADTARWPVSRRPRLPAARPADPSATAARGAWTAAAARLPSHVGEAACRANAARPYVSRRPVRGSAPTAVRCRTVAAARSPAAAAVAPRSAMPIIVKMSCVSPRRRLTSVRGCVDPRATAAAAPSIAVAARLPIRAAVAAHPACAESPPACRPPAKPSGRRVARSETAVAASLRPAARARAKTFVAAAGRPARAAIPREATPAPGCAKTKSRARRARKPA